MPERRDVDVAVVGLSGVFDNPSKPSMVEGVFEFPEGVT